jgi:hypothetical protein
VLLAFNDDGSPIYPPRPEEEGRGPFTDPPLRVRILLWHPVGEDPPALDLKMMNGCGGGLVTINADIRGEVAPDWHPAAILIIIGGTPAAIITPAPPGRPISW